MNIITAKEAREIADNYIPYELETTIEYVMEKIEDCAKSGSKKIDFNPDITPCLYWATIVTKKFEEFMRKHGYGYKHIKEENWYGESEEVTISW